MFSQEDSPNKRGNEQITEDQTFLMQGEIFNKFQITLMPVS